MSFTAGYAEKTYLSSPMAVWRSYGISMRSGISRGINASVLSLLGGVFWVFDGKPLTEDELERQREKILRAPIVVRDREYPFRKDLIPEASGNTDPQLPVLAKVSSLVDVLKLGGNYELVERLWERFVLTASRVNVIVAWSRNEVLVSSVCPPEHSCRPLVTCLLNHWF